MFFPAWRKRKEKKRLQKLTANVGEDVCWRRGNGLMAHALVEHGTEITDPKLPKNWTSAVRWTGDSLSAPRTCAVPEERHTCTLAYRCCWCWEVDDLVCPYQMLKRRQRPRWWGQGDVFEIVFLSKGRFGNVWERVLLASSGYRPGMLLNSIRAKYQWCCEGGNLLFGALQNSHK